MVRGWLFLLRLLRHSDMLLAIYRSNIFTGTMNSTARSESINHTLKSVGLSHQSSVCEVLKSTLTLAQEQHDTFLRKDVTTAIPLGLVGSPDAVKDVMLHLYSVASNKTVTEHVLPLVQSHRYGVLAKVAVNRPRLTCSPPNIAASSPSLHLHTPPYQQLVPRCLECQYP